jgi:hypothetical protein
MADPWTIAGVVGTWIAVAIALIALVGIVTPMLIFWHRRSERYKALIAVDAVQTHYVEKSWRTMFFLRMKVPALKDPPNIEKIPLRVSKRTSLPVKTSSTGWVNFASALEIYTLRPKLPRQKDLVITEEQTWLPVHKLWILAFGLLGRYSHREDHGIAPHKRNTWRLAVEEDSSNYDEERQHFQSPEGEAIDMLEGLTGCLWWIGSRFVDDNDQVYFGRHSTADQQELMPDPTPLSTLFWLSLGCIPLVYPEGYVYDLADFRQPYFSTTPNKDKSVPGFYRYRPRSIQPSDYSSKVAKAMGASIHRVWCIEQHSGRKERESDERESVKEESNQQWINEHGLDREERESPGLGIQEVKKQNVDEQKRGDEDGHHEQERQNLRARNPSLEKTQKDWVQSLTDRGYVHFWRTDVERLAYAIISLPLSPQGFLFGQGRHFPNFNNPGQLWDLIDLIVRSRLVGVTEEEMAQIRTVSELSYEDEDTRIKFSRSRMATFYKCDQTIQRRNWAIPQIVRDIVGVLTLTSGLMLDILNGIDAKKAVCLEVNTEAQSVRMFSSNNGHDMTIAEHHLAIEDIFNPELLDELDGTFRSTLQQQTDIILTCLHASIRERMVRGQLSSECLINTFKKMGDIVHVSSRIQVPRIRQRVPVRDPTFSL